MDTIGLLTHNVADAVEILLEVVSQSDHHSHQKKLKIIRDLSPACTNLDLSGMRIGITWHLNHIKNLHESKFEPFKRVLQVLKQARATFVHDLIITGAEEYENLSNNEKQIILDTDMKISIYTYLSSLKTNPNSIHTLQDLIDFTKSTPAEAYPHRNLVVLERAQSTDITNELNHKMLAKDTYFANEGGIIGALDRHRCAILLVPHDTSRCKHSPPKPVVP
jgi:amidase